MTTQKEIVAAMAKVESALSAAARSRHIPDYAGFRERMARRLVDEGQESSASLHPDPGPTTIAAITLLGRYHGLLKRGSFSPINYRRYKLLFGLFTGSARGSEMVNALFEGEGFLTDPTLDADDVTPATLRMRLIIAVEKGAYDDASFLVGRLDEIDHDPGERTFLRALVAYASGKFVRTIKLVEGIPLDAIDRPKSAWMAVKAAALLADRASLDKLLDEIADRISPFGWLHLIELLGRSLDGQDYPSFRDRVPQQLVGRPADPAYEEWATLHVQTMRPYLTRLREIVAAAEAAGITPSADEIASDATLQQAAPALFVEHVLGRETGAKELAELLDPVIAKGSISAFRACIEMLSDAGEFEIVVRYANRFPHNPALPWHRELDIVGALYSAAVLSDERLSRRLKRLMPPDRLEPVVGAVRRVEIARRLTPMGRTSFLSAAAELDHIKAIDDQWRDCGLISLGLFRALELELNVRLAKPLAARLDVPALRARLPNLSALAASLNELRKASRPGRGMMLGNMRDLLTELHLNPDDDAATHAVRQDIRGELNSLLAAMIDKDRSLNDVGNMISAVVVGKLRNPPAHGQFLRMEDAVEALRHVEDALELITAILPKAE